VHRSKLLQEGLAEDAANEAGPRVVTPGFAGEDDISAAPRPALLKQVI
jgi:hypothetical protein